MAPHDLWPVSAVGEHAQDHRLALTVTHYDNHLTVTVIPGTRGVLSALALWWAATTASLPALDLKSPHDHSPGLHYAPFRENFAAFADWAKTATSTQRWSAHVDACAYAAAFDDASLRALLFDGFLAALPWERDLKPKLLRIPLLH